MCNIFEDKIVNYYDTAILFFLKKKIVLLFPFLIDFFPEIKKTINHNVLCTLLEYILIYKSYKLFQRKKNNLFSFINILKKCQLCLIFNVLYLGVK